MARIYSSTSAGLAAGFPTAVFTPPTYRDQIGDGFAVTGETIVVPSSLAVALDYIPRDQATTTCTMNGAARAWVPYPEAPLTGECSLDLRTGVVRFNAADAGKTAVFAYTAVRSFVGAADVGRLAVEVAAVQEAVGGALQLVTVGKENCEFTTWGAAIAAVKALGDCSATKPYVIAGAPAVYEESVVVDVAHLTLLGLGGPGACVITHSEATDLTMNGALNIQEDSVRVVGLTARNTFTITGALEATTAISVGSLAGGGTFDNVVFSNCIATGNGRDVVFWRGGGSFIFDGCDITGLSHTPAIDANPPGAGTSAVLAGIMRRCRITTTYAPTWIGSGTTDTLTLDMSDCQVVSSAGEPMLYLTGGGTETITLNNCRGVGLYLYQTPAGHTGATTINHGGAWCSAGDRIGALVGTVTLAAITQRAVIAASLSSLDGIVKMNSALIKSTFTGEVYARNSADSADGFFKGSQYISTVATGTAPLTVASTTAVSNLNADLLDGNHATAFVAHAVADAKGDILAATGADALARVAVGTEGQVLSSNAAAAGGVAYIWVPRLIGSTTADSAKLDSGAAQQYFDKTITIPASALLAGMVIRYRATGKFSCGATSRNNYLCLFGGSAGTTVLGDNNTGFGLANMTDAAWQIEGELTVRTTGASGTYASWSQMQFRNALYCARLAYNNLNTTAANVLTIGWKSGTVDAAHYITLEQFRVDVS